MGFAADALSWLVGKAESVPEDVLARFPDLHALRLRRGGLPPRLGGWFLGRASVAGITFGKTVWLAPRVAPSAELLLHEYCHVLQFQAGISFPLRYAWESLRRGYWRNAFEVDARRYVVERLHTDSVGLPDQEQTIG